MGNSIYEQVETGDELPFDVSLHSVNYVPSHWHNSLEIIFVLRGTLEVTLNGRKRRLTEGDVLLINDCRVHEVIGLNLNIIATFLIPTAKLREIIRDIDSINFDCDSTTAGNERKKALDKLRQYLAEMVQLQQKKDDTFALEMRMRMVGVLSILMKQFQVPTSSDGLNEKYMERMLRITRYIDEHYREPISLSELSEKEFLSVPYLSKFISENLGMNFQAYLTGIRLKNAVEDLLRSGSEVSLADLGMNHGFPNAKSFYAAFKAKYETTPNEYRKQYRPDRDPNEPKGNSNYFEFNRSNALGIIQQYLRRGGDSAEEPRALETRSYRIDASAGGEPIRHTWKTLITFGRAKEGLHADVQTALRYVQRACPFRYARFHGIFDDDMMVYHEDSDGRPVYNFRFVDQLFDFMLSIGLKPFVELGFMPSKMAADPSLTVFYMKSYVSKPKSTERWGELIDRFLVHCLNRYGADEVESWKFEFWNEPEFDVFWPNEFEDYLDLYEITYRTLKARSERLLIGAPGRIITLDSQVLMRTFFSFCRERSCLPDFFPLHFYPHDKLQAEQSSGVFSLGTIERLMDEYLGISQNPNYLRESLKREKRWLEELGFKDAELYLTEWNSTAYHRELTNDTLYKAAYIVKNIVDNLDFIEGFGYWVASDNIEETPASAQLFHGGLGLLAQHGIPKAGMLAFELLAKLGDRLISKGDGYIVTAGRSGYQILTFNYCHFDDLYALGDISFIDETNRYNAFKGDKTVKLTIELDGLPAGKYRAFSRALNRKHGSSFDLWVDMGAPSSLSEDDIEYLRVGARPRRRTEELRIDGLHMAASLLEPLAVELIELYPVFE